MLSLLILCFHTLCEIFVVYAFSKSFYKIWLMDNTTERCINLITNHMMHAWLLLLLIYELFRRSWHRHNTAVRISLCHPDSSTDSEILRIIFILLYSFVVNLSLTCIKLSRPCMKWSRQCMKWSRLYMKLTRPCIKWSRPCMKWSRLWMKLFRPCMELSWPSLNCLK